MKTAAQALIPILNGIYSEIREIEAFIGIQVDTNDMRPRIEYFHDAIRTFTNGILGSKRLSVEFLAYDIAMLRHIQSNPLARSKGTRDNLSPNTNLAVVGDASNRTNFTNFRLQLTDLYKNYSVLFVALLSEVADRNYKTRVDEHNNDVENIAVLEHSAKATLKQRDSEINIEELINQYIDEPELAQKILAAFAGKKKTKASVALQKLSEMTKNADKQIKTIEEAHLKYTTNQLGVYEDAKNVVKKMAINGMNIVGDFVENAVRTANKGGRGF